MRRYQVTGILIINNQLFPTASPGVYSLYASLETFVSNTSNYVGALPPPKDYWVDAGRLSDDVWDGKSLIGLGDAAGRQAHHVAIAAALADAAWLLNRTLGGELGIVRTCCHLMTSAVVCVWVSVKFSVHSTESSKKKPKKNNPPKKQPFWDGCN